MASAWEGLPASFTGAAGSTESVEPLEPSPDDSPGFSTRVFRGCVVQAPTFGRLTVDPHATVVVDARTGRIAAYYSSADALLPAARAAVAAAHAEGALTVLGPREFLLPGFVDCHLHAPQYSYAGTGLVRALGREFTGRGVRSQLGELSWVIAGR